MAINSRQFHLLSHIGIELWKKKLPLTQTLDNKPQSTATPVALPITLEQLAHSQLAIDVLLCCGLSLSEITIEKNIIQLNLLNWQFVQSNEITLTQRVLSTPPLNELAQHPVLKRQLWQLLREQHI